MVSAKLYTSNEEILYISKEIGNQGILLDEKRKDCLVCKAFDSGNQNKLYLICSVNDSELWIHDVNQNRNEDYLLDVCIRMVLHYFFNQGRHQIVFQLNEENRNLQEVCIRIGFTLVQKTSRSTKISIKDEQFYKNKC